MQANKRTDNKIFFLNDQDIADYEQLLLLILVRPIPQE